MSFHEPRVAINQVGKIKQIADFLSLIFFNARRAYVVYAEVTTYIQDC